MDIEIMDDDFIICRYEEITLGEIIDAVGKGCRGCGCNKAHEACGDGIMSGKNMWISDYQDNNRRNGKIKGGYQAGYITHSGNARQC